MISGGSAYVNGSWGLQPDGTLEVVGLAVVLVVVAMVFFWLAEKMDKK